MLILDGKAVKKDKTALISKRFSCMEKQISFVIVQIGDKSESNAYIKNKIIFGNTLGVKVIHEKMPENVSLEKILEIIKKYNEDDFVKGIIVQLPIPENLSRQKILNAILPEKDIDGLSEENIKRLEKGEFGFVPATARGVSELLEFYKINVYGKKVVVMGRSELVGKPVARLMEKLGAEVSVVHSKTENPKEITKTADILIVAIGRVNFVDESFVKAGAIVIDIGINTIFGEKFDEDVSEKKLVGDVNFESVKNVVSAITPVPGGVGQMTVVALFENLLDAE